MIYHLKRVHLLMLELLNVMLFVIYIIPKIRMTLYCNFMSHLSFFWFQKVISKKIETVEIRVILRYLDD